MISIIRSIIIISNIFFMFYLIVYSTYNMIAALYGSIEMYRNRRKEKLHNLLEHEYLFPISILVPAYNESVAIIQTIKNLLYLDYKQYEIVVIDDGSKDDTKQQVIDAFSLIREENRPINYRVPCKKINEIYTGKVNDILITLISKENGGCKADASNAGINVASYPYFVNMDADEILQRDALTYAARAFLENDNVIGVGGSIKLSNCTLFKDANPVATEVGKELLVDMQVIEYGRAFVGTKIFQNIVNMNLIISGGFGVFKKSAVIEAGGFDVKSMGEDMELTVRLHQHNKASKKKYKMKYIPDSVCWTQGPASMKDLTKQRQRWYCGLLQTIGKYKYMIFNPKYGMVGMFMMPYIVLFEVLNPFMMLLGWFAIAWTVLDNTINFPYVFYVYLLYLLFGILLSLVSYMDKIFMKRDEINFKKSVITMYTAIVDSLFFRPYLSIVSLIAFFRRKSISKTWVSPKRILVNSSTGEKTVD